jgi:hypothetical protein
MTPAVATLTSSLGANLIYEHNEFGGAYQKNKNPKHSAVKTITKDY